jgi:hypothetical protein
MGRLVAAGADELREGEIVRRLRLLRHGPENRASVRGGRKIPLKCVAELAGLHRVTLYRAIFEGRISDKTREALSPVLNMLQRAPVPHPPQAKLVRAADYCEWCPCLTCGGIGFSPVMMSEAKWFFCNGCLPPEQYPALGARAC